MISADDRRATLRLEARARQLERRFPVLLRLPRGLISILEAERVRRDAAGVPAPEFIRSAVWGYGTDTWRGWTRHDVIVDLIWDALGDGGDISELEAAATAPDISDLVDDDGSSGGGNRDRGGALEDRGYQRPAETRCALCCHVHGVNARYLTDRRDGRCTFVYSGGDLCACAVGGSRGQSPAGDCRDSGRPLPRRFSLNPVHLPGPTGRGAKGTSGAS